jgi:AcrR family transcriptional regulator
MAVSETSGAETANAVRAVATRAFRDNGYAVATLDDIANELGISRPAILHHFGSKQELLNQIVRPYLADLDVLLDEFEAAMPLDDRGRRRLVTALVDLIAEHRGAAALLTRDITAHPVLAPDLQMADRIRRFSALMVQANDDGDLAIVRGLAAVGAIARTTTAPEDIVDFDDPEVRAALVDAAVAALRSNRPKR